MSGYFKAVEGMVQLIKAVERIADSLERIALNFDDPCVCSCFMCQGRACGVMTDGGLCVLERGHEGGHRFWT